jgi:DNA gyrase subunit A
MAVEDLRVMGRATQGVKLINLKGNDSIAAVAKVMHDEDEVDENGDLITPDTTQISNQNEDGTTLDKSQEEE